MSDSGIGWMSSFHLERRALRLHGQVVRCVICEQLTDEVSVLYHHERPRGSYVVVCVCPAHDSQVRAIREERNAWAHLIQHLIDLIY